MPRARRNVNRPAALAKPGTQPKPPRHWQPVPAPLDRRGWFFYLERMSAARKIKPTDKAIRAYYEALETYQRQDVEHETATSTAFQNLLDQVGRHFGWTLIPQLTDTAAGTLDPARRHLPRRLLHHPRPLGGQGHPRQPGNRDPQEDRQGLPAGQHHFRGHARRRYLYQNGQQAMKVDLTEPQAACRPAERLFRLHRAGPRGFRQGHRRVQGAGAGPGPRAGREDQRRPPEQPAVHRGVRRSSTSCAATR